MISNTVSLKVVTSRRAKIGPIPLMTPEPRYFSMPSAEVGGATLRNVARNCRPWSRWVSHLPLACTYSPAETDGAAPSTVTRSFCPRTLTRKTQNPLSGLWKVTRSTRPDSGSRSSAELNRGFPLGATLHIFQTRDVRPLSGRVRPIWHYSPAQLSRPTRAAPHAPATHPGHGFLGAS